MLVKSADDKTPRLQFLQSLRRLPLSDVQRYQLENDIYTVESGIQGEKNAAYYLNLEFARSENVALIHDLRLKHNEQVAQIDHLTINRMGMFCLLETKHFNGRLKINAQGEFSVQYRHTTQGIPSPLEQSRRHEKVLQYWLQTLDIHARIGQELHFSHAVLCNPKQEIERPPPEVFDSSAVMKYDMYVTWRRQMDDRLLGSVAGLMSAVLQMRSAQTVHDWARALVRQHCPDDPCRLPPYIPAQMMARPSTRPITVAQAGGPSDTPRPSATPAPTARAPAPTRPAATPVAPPPPAPAAPATRVRTASPLQARPVPRAAPAPGPTMAQPAAQRPRYFCAHCKNTISTAQAQFCWNKPERFQGRAYCLQHQALFPPVPQPEGHLGQRPQMGR